MKSILSCFNRLVINIDGLELIETYFSLLVWIATESIDAYLPCGGGWVPYLGVVFASLCCDDGVFGAGDLRQAAGYIEVAAILQMLWRQFGQSCAALPVEDHRPCGLPLLSVLSILWQAKVSLLPFAMVFSGFMVWIMRRLCLFRIQIPWRRVLVGLLFIENYLLRHYMHRLLLIKVDVW